MTVADEIEVQHEDSTLWLTVNRPLQNNALGPESVVELLDKVRGMGPETRVCVLAGAGERAFIAGADIKRMLAMSPAEAERFAATGQDLTRAMERSHVVFCAVVDGFALGGGTELALACDVVVATADARFGLPEVRLGIFPGWGGTQRLIRTAGPARALPLLLTGRQFDATTARDLGVVSEVVTDAPSARLWVDDLLSDLKGAGPTAVAGAKRAARLGVDTTMEVGLDIERSLWTAQFDGPERTEGMGAFVERRLPAWSHGSQDE